MKLVRCCYNNKIYSGKVEGSEVVFSDPSIARVPLSHKDVRLLSPVEPSKIVSVGLNYKPHAKELGMEIPSEPIIFLKPPTSVVGPRDAIIYPESAGRVDYEAELAVVIKKTARFVSKKDVNRYILGYTCFNDVTARDLQAKDGQWTRAKSFDTFAPIGPCIETELDPKDLRVRTYLNGQIKQESRTSEFIFDIPRLMEFISGIMTLLPGDVIATGTPKNVGPMCPGDEVVVEIENIGKLKNHVV